jgi:ATP-dependent DNA ligase
VEGPRVRLVATFEDGEALFAAVCERGLEGVVASASATRFSRASVSG